MEEQPPVQPVVQPPLHLELFALHAEREEVVRGSVQLRVEEAPELREEGRAPVRAGAPLYASEDARSTVGAVTSGGFGPSLDAPIAMGYLPSALAAPGTKIFAELRCKRLPASVTTLPFIVPKYKRG